MANPFFKAMGGNQAATNPMANKAQQIQQFQQQFNQFKQQIQQQMNGSNPYQMISELISSGKANQNQLNQAQQQAQQMWSVLGQFGGKPR